MITLSVPPGETMCSLAVLIEILSRLFQERAVKEFSAGEVRAVWMMRKNQSVSIGVSHVSYLLFIVILLVQFTRGIFY